MRYYVISRSELDQIAPHIIAEVVRGQTDDRRETLAAALAGKDHMIVTREQLTAHPLGLEALKAWDDDNDSAYDAECEALKAAQPVTSSNAKPSQPLLPTV